MAMHPAHLTVVQSAPPPSSHSPAARMSIAEHSRSTSRSHLCHFGRPQHGSQRWDDGRTPEEALKDLGVSRLSPRDAAKLHSDLRAAQVSVVASRMKWAALLKETDTVSRRGPSRGGCRGQCYLVRTKSRKEIVLVV